VELGSDGISVEIVGDTDIIGAWRVRSALNVSEHFFIVGNVESCSIESLGFVLSEKDFRGIGSVACANGHVRVDIFNGLYKLKIVPYRQGPFLWRRMGFYSRHRCTCIWR
jgi:hypothetical protein